MKAILLFSGGLDSTTLLADLLAPPDTKEVLCLSASYGSNHNEQERKHQEAIIHFYRSIRRDKRVLHELLTLPNLWEGSGSALMGEAEVPVLAYADGPQPTVVPFRNGVLIAAAVAIAASRGYSDVFIAAHASDAANYAYPDCTPDFLIPMRAAVYVGTMKAVRLINPYVNATKVDVVSRGLRNKAPLHLTYSCYRGGEKPCGHCATCLERMGAFAANGVKDPVEYE